MHLLTKEYFAQNKGMALFGAGLSLSAAVMLHFFPIAAFAPSAGMWLLNFPYIARTPAERGLRLVLIGLVLSLVLVYSAKWAWPLGVMGLIGSTVFGTCAICLRHCPPAAEPPHTVD